MTQNSSPAGSRITCQECTCCTRSAPSPSSLATSAARSSVWMSIWADGAECPVSITPGCSMRHVSADQDRHYGGLVTDTDAIVAHVLTTYDTITVVGASAAPAKAAHFVPAHMQQHGWRIIPVNPHADAILGEHAYRTLRDVPGQVGLVNVFRPPEQTPDIARQAVAAGATALWLQLGIASQEARAI